MSILAPPSIRQNQLSPSDYEECCTRRGLNPSWIKAGCQTQNQTQATDYLGYPAKSGGILIEGANGQGQLRPHKPWSNKPGQKAPKYRTALGDEYDALLPAHPTDKYHWNHLSSLKQKCYKINDIPLLIITEGGFKAIALCSHELPTLALLEVEMGLTSSKDDPQGKRYLVPELERFAKEGFGFIFAFDADTYTKKPVKQALIKLARQIQKYNVPVYNLPEWDESDGKGVDDFVQNKGIEEFRKQLLSQAYCFDDWYEKYGEDAFTTVGGNKIPKPDLVGAEIAEQYSDRWVYCDELKTWLTYSLETEGIWTLVSKDYLAAEIHAILKARNITGYGTNAYVENIIGTLKRELFIRKWDEKSSTDWLPFKNGVLELATNKLHEHNPGFKFTWQLPRDYTVVENGWQSIDNWLNEATKGNSEYKELLLCFAAAVLRGRNDLQKFLHLIGGGGSGKSTFTTLLTALVGESNTATMNLSELEDKHEIARIFGKRLVVLPDQDKAPRKMSNFKRLTGQDRLSGRRLFENGFEYVFGGLTVVTSNFPIFHTNLGSWLTRRVSMIPFDYQCPKHQKRDLMKDFEGELGAFTSYLLSIPEAEIEAVLKGVGDRKLSATVWESQIRSDGLAAWVNEWVIQDSTGCVPIGSNAHEWKIAEDYDATCSTLYGSYTLYCQQTKRSAKSPQNFSAELLELTNRTLGWSTEKARVKIAGKTVRVIKGLKLRELYDNEPTYEEILQGDNQGDRGGDNSGDNQGDNLKVPPDKEGEGSSPGVSPGVYEPRDNSDNLHSNFESTEKNFSLSDKSGTEKEEKDKNYQTTKLNEEPPRNTVVNNSFSGTPREEVSNKNASNKSSLAPAPVTIPTQQRVEAVSPSLDKPPVVTQVVTTPVTQVVTPQINWKTYPYNSSDSTTLENRALKVKERILNCSTSNDLIKLLATTSASEPEINWLKENYLSSAEKQQLTLIENSTQGNLFLVPERSSVIEYKMSEIIESIDIQMNRVGWSKEKGRQYLMETYGKKSRIHLSDNELLEFRDYLKSLE